MSKFYLVLVLIWMSIISLSQEKDRISYHLNLNPTTNILTVYQTFELTNSSQQDLEEIYIHAWANAYSGRLTRLNEIKLQDRKGALHFSEKEERGHLQYLVISQNSNLLSYEIVEREFVKLNLSEPWVKGTRIQLLANYEVKIPKDVFTKYGYNEQQEFLLKYFFLQPATQDEKGKWVLQHYQDFEELSANPTNVQLTMDQLDEYDMASDLFEENKIWRGENMEHFRLFLTPKPENIQHFKSADQNLQIEFGYALDSIQKDHYAQLLPKQLQFLEDHFGPLPMRKLFISSKTKREQDFLGVDDLDAWILELKLFTEEEKNALKLFQVLAYEYIDHLFVVNKNQDHWIKNGLQYYVMMKYVDHYYPTLKLAGQLPDKLSVLGIKPLNYFHASKLKMNERYKFLYLYLARQNYDQPIETDFDELSNLNQIAISGFKTGISFYYIDQYLGGNEFDHLIKNFSNQNRGKRIQKSDFQQFLQQYASKDLDWFFEDYVDKKDKINFKLVKLTDAEDSLQIHLKNQTEFQGPFQISAFRNEMEVERQWYVSPTKDINVNFPKGDYDKIEVNSNYLLPEFNDRDNFLRTKGLFKNGKKWQLKLYSDIENPEYSQIFVNPQIRWNNYDKFLIGMRFHNQSLLTRPFEWNLSPKFSTGTGKLAGGASVSNTFMPQHGWFQAIKLGGSMKYEHYDQDLTYLKWSLYSTLNFRKNPRETLSHGFIFAYDNLDKEVPQFETQTHEEKYGLWNATYFYSRPDYIHESHGSVTYQMTNFFQKVMGEFYYRWRFATKKQLGVRLFVGTFLENQSNSDYFNFGVSHVSDYSFNLNLLGRSESSGVLSQEYVLAESGFKSKFDFTINRWIVSTNVELPIWKLFDLYADAGVFKNRLQNPEFIYDTGLKIKVIPDFLEFYLPIQSSLGFEPSMDNYWERIRFTFNFNLSSIINHLRRGWY
ncbi:hypothetical protein [Moheibacter stercoris]|uniref:Aminopeptidase n=1 Tax=Moheibacter stercoris TaxID=1628251 RepID=A0ABV2LTM6_9FLAO